jgi:hypothetical protein
MCVDCFNGCTRAGSLGIVARKIMKKPSLVYGFSVQFPSEKCKIVPLKKGLRRPRRFASFFKALFFNRHRQLMHLYCVLFSTINIYSIGCQKNVTCETAFCFGIEQGKENKHRRI